MKEDKELLLLVEHTSWRFFELSTCSLKGWSGMSGRVFLIIDVLG